MHVTCLTDSLRAGGAQRQLCTLAVLMKQRGIDVSMLTYHPADFFLPMIEEAGIDYECVTDRSLIRRAMTLRKRLRGGDHDVVLAFQSHCSVYAEIASLPTRNWGLVVSERSAVPGSQHGRSGQLKKLHRLADYVTTNSHTNRMIIEDAVPSLAQRIVTVYNTVDPTIFSPRAATPRDPAQLHLVVAASYRELKNPVRLVEAIAAAGQKLPDRRVTLSWYGGVPGGREVYERALQRVAELRLEDSVQLHLASDSIVDEYHAADAVVLPSFYEGLPNVVCEAMACGRPILMSNVADAGNLVHDAVNGFLFDPHSVEDMAAAIVKLGSLSQEQQRAFGQSSREMAERYFDPARIVDTYVSILEAAAARSRVSIEHWIPQIPDSARHTLN